MERGFGCDELQNLFAAADFQMGRTAFLLDIIVCGGHYDPLIKSEFINPFGTQLDN